MAESELNRTSNPLRLLLVEDDRVLGSALERGLTDFGHRCVWERDGFSAIRRAERDAHDCVILDLMLPDITGLEVLSRMRSTGNTAPVVVLTARGTVEERVAGLNAGADDYLVKPFAFPELVARLEAVCRRSAQLPRDGLGDTRIHVNLATRRIVRDGKEIELTPTELKLLVYLMRNPHQTVTRRMLCQHLWEADMDGITNVIEVHINRLRAKIDRGFEHPVIHTVRGLGYAYRPL